MESFTKHIDFFNIILLLLSKCQLQWQDPVIFFFAFMILFIIHKKEKIPISYLHSEKHPAPGGHKKQKFGRVAPL